MTQITEKHLKIKNGCLVAKFEPVKNILIISLFRNFYIVWQPLIFAFILKVNYSTVKRLY